MLRFGPFLPVDIYLKKATRNVYFEHKLRFFPVFYKSNELFVSAKVGKITNCNNSPVQTVSDMKKPFVNDILCCHPVVCVCVFAPVSDCGPAGSLGKGELLWLSRLGELLVVETSLLLQLLVDEEEEALDTTKPGERQPCRPGEGTQTSRSVRTGGFVFSFCKKLTRSSFTTVNSSSSFPLSHGWKYLKPCEKRRFKKQNRLGPMNATGAFTDL